MKRSMKVTALLLILVLSLCAFAGCKEEAPTAGKKDITVTIVYKDATSEKLELSTEAEFLADALVEAKVVEYAEDGYYTTVKGVTADYSVDKGWWCLTKDGQMTTDGLNTQKIADGDAFELTYTIG